MSSAIVPKPAVLDDRALFFRATRAMLDTAVSAANVDGITVTRDNDSSYFTVKNGDFNLFSVRVGRVFSETTYNTSYRAEFDLSFRVYKTSKEKYLRLRKNGTINPELAIKLILQSVSEMERIIKQDKIDAIKQEIEDDMTRQANTINNFVFNKIDMDWSDSRVRRCDVSGKYSLKYVNRIDFIFPAKRMLEVAAVMKGLEAESKEYIKQLKKEEN
jgi:hypothetical protein